MRAKLFLICLLFLCACNDKNINNNAVNLSNLQSQFDSCREYQFCDWDDCLINSFFREKTDNFIRIGDSLLLEVTFFQDCGEKEKMFYCLKQYDSLFADYLYYIGQISVVKIEKNCLDAQFLASYNFDNDTVMHIYNEYKQWNDSLITKSIYDLKWDWSYSIRRNEGQLMRDNWNYHSTYFE